MSDRATLMIAASESDSNLYYATRFIAPDPFIFMDVKGRRILLMSDLEMDRARNQATVDQVLSYSEWERRAKAQGISAPGSVDVLHLVLQDHAPCRKTAGLLHRDGNSREHKKRSDHAECVNHSESADACRVFFTLIYEAKNFERDHWQDTGHEVQDQSPKKCKREHAE